MTGWLFQANISPIKPISTHPLTNSHYWHIGGRGLLNKQHLEFYSCLHHKGPKLALLPSEFHFPEGAPVASAEAIFCLFSKPADMPGLLG